MIFHENRLLADDSHVISYLIFIRKLGKMSQNLSSAAVMIGTLRVNPYKPSILFAGHRHTMQTQGLLCLFTECSIKIGIKMKNTTQQP